MKSDIQIFKNSQFGEVRVIELDGKTYFVGNDVAKAFGYASPKDATSRHCKVAKFHHLPDNQGFIQKTKVIPEGDIYHLAAKSELPRAEAFESWIFDEVLPSIRKTGGYIVAKADETPEEIMARALVVAQDTLERQKQRVQMLEGEKELLEKVNKQLAPKAEYTDKVLQSTSTYTMTQVAKELGMSAVLLGRKLRDADVMFRQSGQWMLYAKYQDKGYTSTRTHHYPREGGTTGSKAETVWTERGRGRAFVHRLFESNKISGNKQATKQLKFLRQ
jgi:prophage antirepressor-like protein